MGIAALIVLAGLATWIGYALHRRRRKPAAYRRQARRANDNSATDADYWPIAYVGGGHLAASTSDANASSATGEQGETSASGAWGNSGSTGEWGESGASDFGGDSGGDSGGGDGGGGSD